jgi:hypothetical protein
MEDVGLKVSIWKEGVVCWIRHLISHVDPHFSCLVDEVAEQGGMYLCKLEGEKSRQFG